MNLDIAKRDLVILSGVRTAFGTMSGSLKKMTATDLAVPTAQAALEVANAARVKAEANWKRAQELKPQGHVSEQMYDEAQAAEASSIAEVARAEAALALDEETTAEALQAAAIPMAEAAIPRRLFATILRRIARLRPVPV